ncbi:hypothetical protein [Sediminivirga luteola]|nr:hypothetical protein [Sediminivirga luteola]MCI2266808.1 hypothetical protein [Sediminivirga luteola]
MDPELLVEEHYSVSSCDLGERLKGCSSGHLTSFHAEVVEGAEPQALGEHLAALEEEHGFLPTLKLTEDAVLQHHRMYFIYDSPNEHLMQLSAEEWTDVIEVLLAAEDVAGDVGVRGVLYRETSRNFPVRLNLVLREDRDPRAESVHAQLARQLPDPESFEVTLRDLPR